MRQFDIGQVVTCVVRHAAPGDYRIVGLMPDRDGDRMYRVKSPREDHERVVKETLLERSEGYLPEEETPKRRSRRGVTLPTLQERLECLTEAHSSRGQSISAPLSGCGNPDASASLLDV
jgi:hypothetical protein